VLKYGPDYVPEGSGAATGTKIAVDWTRLSSGEIYSETFARDQPEVIGPMQVPVVTGEHGDAFLAIDVLTPNAIHAVSRLDLTCSH
jgi:hypothetical protein